MSLAQIRRYMPLAGKRGLLHLRRWQGCKGKIELNRNISRLACLPRRIRQPLFNRRQPPLGRLGSGRFLPLRLLQLVVLLL